MATQHASSLLLLLEKQFESSVFTDLRVVCRDGEVQSYRVLLGACSDMVLDCLSAGEPEEPACLIMPGLRVQEVEAFHRALFCFTQTPSHSQLDNVLQVLAAIGVNIGPFIDVNIGRLGEEVKSFPLGLQKKKLVEDCDREKPDEVTLIVPNGLEVIPVGTVTSVKQEDPLKYAMVETSCLFCNKNYKSLDTTEHRCVGDIVENRTDITGSKSEDEDVTTTFTFNVNESDEIVSKSGPTCAKCLSEFPTEIDFEKHKMTECNKQYACKICNKIFSSSQTLTNHTKLHTNDLEYECGVCGKQYVSRSVLGNHMKTHDSSSKIPRFNCMHCTKKFTHPSNLKRHIRTAHFEMSDKKTYDCMECDKSFRDPSALKHHSKTHLDVRPFPCDLCTKSFGSKTQLDNHLRIHTGEKPFLCNLCGRCFVTKGQLKSHKLNRHIGVKHKKSHLCQDCGQSFVKEFDLKVHMRKHSGERPFSCLDCGKTFRSERNLANHQRIHTGDKPYQCETCDKTFASCAGLRQHFKCHTACRLQATEGAYCRQERKPNRYGRVRLESIPELSMDEASSLQTLENFSVPDLKDSTLGSRQAVEETVVYFSPDSMALVDTGDMEAGLEGGIGGTVLEGVTIQAIGLEMDVGESGEVLSLVQI